MRLSSVRNVNAHLSHRERRRPPSAAVLKNAEAELRLRRIARYDPGEGLRSLMDTSPLTRAFGATSPRRGEVKGSI